MRVYDEVREAVLNKGYKFFDKELSLNLVWIRKSDQITGEFTDEFVPCWMEASTGKILNLRATTMAGLYGAFMDPITYQGVTGTAVIIPGQYPGAWEFVDSYKGFTGYPYYSQVGPMNYWRDFDKDTVIDHVQEQDQKNFSTCGHRMTNNGKYTGIINSPGAVWSLGCMGCPEPDWKRHLPIARVSAKKFGTRFTVTLLEGKDF